MNQLKDIKIKVCGMRAFENIQELYKIEPDFMGMIFWEPSKRYVESEIPQPTNKKTKLIGVFVNETIDRIVDRVKSYKLSGVQLHGKELPEFCNELKNRFKSLDLEVFMIKAFAVDESFDFSPLDAYQDYCDYFLFDTKGDLPGGTGKTFSWDLLSKYHLNTPYFLSGGISKNHLYDLIDFFKSESSKKCVAIDLNSKFELSPALKDIEQLKGFKTGLQQLSF